MAWLAFAELVVKSAGYATELARQSRRRDGRAIRDVASALSSRLAAQFESADVEAMTTLLAEPQVVVALKHLVQARIADAWDEEWDSFEQELPVRLEVASRALDLSASAKLRVPELFLEIVDATAEEIWAQSSDTDALQQRAIGHLQLTHMRSRPSPETCSMWSAPQTIEPYLRAEKAARRAASERYGYITPPDLDNANDVPIDDLYVTPHLVSSGLGEPDAYKDGVPVSPELIATTGTRTLVLGDPGGGKSTLSKKLVHDIGRGHYQPELAISPVPLFVVLREYGTARARHHQSIVSFMSQAVIESSYQVVDAPDDFIQFLLSNERAIVVFDGLDELLVAKDRQEIARDIELFCAHYPNVPVLVTSRFVGYHQAPFREGLFREFRLAKFSDNQIKAYARKWYSIRLTARVEEKESFVESFMLDSQLVPDLRSNPLLLSLLCTIYRTERYLPENRPAVYDKCATMLFERWDKSRGIGQPLQIASHVRPALMRIASTLYESDDWQSGISEARLVELTVAYLLDWRYEDRYEAQEAATEFIEFCRGRAWVLSEVGLDRHSEALFAFTHRTFLEYFAAGDFIRRPGHTTGADLAGFLLPRIMLAEWDVVAQLSVQMLQATREGAADEFLSVMISAMADAEAAPRSRYSIASFCARVLGYIVPRPATARASIEAMFAVLFSIARSAARGNIAISSSARQPVPDKLARGNAFEHFELRAVFEELADAHPANARHVIEQTNALVQSAARDDELCLVAGGLLVFKWPILAGNRVPEGLGIAADSALEGAFDRLGIVDAPLWLVLQMLEAGKLTVEELCSVFGSDAFFDNCDVAGMGIALGPAMNRAFYQYLGALRRGDDLVPIWVHDLFNVVADLLARPDEVKRLLRNISQGRRPFFRRIHPEVGGLDADEFAVQAPVSALRVAFVIALFEGVHWRADAPAAEYLPPGIVAALNASDTRVAARNFVQSSEEAAELLSVGVRDAVADYLWEIALVEDSSSERLSPVR